MKRDLEDQLEKCIEELQRTRKQLEQEKEKPEEKRFLTENWCEDVLRDLKRYTNDLEHAKSHVTNLKAVKE